MFTRSGECARAHRSDKLIHLVRHSHLPPWKENGAWCTQTSFSRSRLGWIFRETTFERLQPVHSHQSYVRFRKPHRSADAQLVDSNISIPVRKLVTYPTQPVSVSPITCPHFLLAKWPHDAAYPIPGPMAPILRHPLGVVFPGSAAYILFGVSCSFITTQKSLEVQLVPTSAQQGFDRATLSALHKEIRHAAFCLRNII